MPLMSDLEKEAVWKDFEESWQAIKRESPIRFVNNRASDLKEQLEIACLKTAHDLKGFAKTYEGRDLTSETLNEVVAKSVQLFMSNWYQGLRSQNLAGLIELVIEGQDLTITELRGFLKALPQSLLNRILDSAVGSNTMSGVHALIALEATMRTKGISDYRLDRQDGKIFVEFEDPKNAFATVRFSLDEAFSV